MYARDQINDALNRACDAVQAMAWNGDSEDITDATNLLVNVGLHFLANPGASLREAIAENYGPFGEFLPEVVSDVLEAA